MKIRKLDFWFIISIVAILFLILGYYSGQNILIKEFREVGIDNLCNLIT